MATSACKIALRHRIGCGEMPSGLAIEMRDRLGSAGIADGGQGLVGADADQPADELRQGDGMEGDGRWGGVRAFVQRGEADASCAQFGDRGDEVLDAWASTVERGNHAGVPQVEEGVAGFPIRTDRVRAGLLVREGLLSTGRSGSWSPVDQP
ncbi:hypothetical protein [Streptomyces sp. Wh19]|uniref:hypothetical protein n=1 Tax=Streptomyces sp. Wh19 TaxID=3076629 RepID=UPI002958CA1D|nr:hypothetical protein [Streptomyces sp. Wh19]MDV9198646.1 hypothetical protein [Streptomyces sp. Wh19]